MRCLLRCVVTDYAFECADGRVLVCVCMCADICLCVRLRSFASIREWLDDMHMTSPALLGMVKLGVVTAIMLNILGGCWYGEIIATLLSPVPRRRKSSPRLRY